MSLDFTPRPPKPLFQWWPDERPTLGWGSVPYRPGVLLMVLGAALYIAAMISWTAGLLTGHDVHAALQREAEHQAYVNGEQAIMRARGQGYEWSVRRGGEWPDER